MAKTIRVTNGLGAIKDIVPNRLKEHQALGWKEVEATEEKKTDAKEVEATEEKKTTKKK